MPTRTTPIAYRALAEELRQAIRRGDYADGRPLPTEQELAIRFSVSRHTVRRAMQDLVAEGAVYRVAGSGTYPIDNKDRYFRNVGSIEDLMALSEDTEAVVVRPLAREVDPSVASRLRLATDEVYRVELVRSHDGARFSHTAIYLPPAIATELAGEPFLTGAAPTSRATVIGMIEGRTGHRLFGAEQSVTTAFVPALVAPFVDLEPGDAALRIDRLYVDARERGLELAISHFNPARYSYRITLRR